MSSSKKKPSWLFRKVEIPPRFYRNIEVLLGFIRKLLPLPIIAPLILLAGILEGYLHQISVEHFVFGPFAFVLLPFSPITWVAFGMLLAADKLQEQKRIQYAYNMAVLGSIVLAWSINLLWKGTLDFLFNGMIT